jgi:hypothetical protein
MLPAPYQLPAGALLLGAGVLACFYGYRSFRIVLAIFGFLFGAFVTSSFFGASSTGPMVVAALVGGLVGAGLLYAAYFVGVALTGAVLGAVIANLAFATGNHDPGVLTVILCAIAGAIGAMYLQRYFIIVGTAFGGAWTMIVGAMALLGDKRAMAAAASQDVWVMYPLDPAPGRRWVPVVWIVLSLVGTAIQLGWTGGERGRVGRRKKK